MLEPSRSVIELREQAAARAGPAPAPSRLTGGWTTIIRPGKLVSAAGIAPAIPRSQAERVAPTLRAAGGPEGSCTLNPPADNPDASGLIELRVQKWWEVLVMLQSSLPTLFADTGFTDRQPEHLPAEVEGALS